METSVNTAALPDLLTSGSVTDFTPLVFCMSFRNVCSRGSEAVDSRNFSCCLVCAAWLGFCCADTCCWACCCAWSGGTPWATSFCVCCWTWSCCFVFASDCCCLTESSCFWSLVAGFVSRAATSSGPFDPAPNPLAMPS